MAMKVKPLDSQSIKQAIRGLRESARARQESDVYFGKRGWTRYGSTAKLDVTTDPDDPDAVMPAMMYNVSGGGVGMWLKRSMPMGTRIQVRECTPLGGGQWIPATVAHCTLGIQGYLVGAEFLDPLDTETDRLPETQSAGTVSQPKEDAAARAGSSGVFLSDRSVRIKCGLAAAVSACVGFWLGAWVLDAIWPSHASVWLYLIVSIFSGAVGALAGWLVVGPEVRLLNDAVTAIRSIIKSQVVDLALPRRVGREGACLREALLDFEAKLRTRERDERAHREKLEELNRIKNNFLSIVSHDLRTPLTSILLYARMLIDQPPDLNQDDRRHFLEIIAEECNRLSRLVDDLLEVQRLEADRVEWKVRRANLVEVIQTSVSVFEAMAQSKSIRLSMDCPASLPSVVMDSERIAQVINNLLSNAVKYTPAGGAVRISAEAHDREVLVRVKDTGPGIPRDKWDAIFDRFCQLTDRGVCEFGGFGLGLYIVKWIVERHGGAVWVDGEVAKGSEFCFSLATHTPAFDEPKGDRATPTHRAVVCDAAPEVAATIAQMLRAHAFEVRPAHSAARLLTHLNDWDPELVITDLQLPDMDAPQLLDRISAVPRRPLFQLIVHSHVHKWLAKVPGVDVLLPRPVSKEELLQAVDFAGQRRHGKGQVILVVGSQGQQTERLLGSLARSGHTAMAAAGPAQAPPIVQRYPLDQILVLNSCLSDAWSEIDLLRVDGSSARITVLSQLAGRKDRQLAEQHGVGLLAYDPGYEEELARSVLTQEAETLEAQPDEATVAV
jgi:signal transduction histidine kinase/DNA-binding NarL/FixJ family response regulator